MPRVVAVERESGASILALFHDLGTALGQMGSEMVLVGATDANVKACQSVIRHALAGGADGLVDGEQIAVGDTLAGALVETYCYPTRPMIHDAGLAWRILEAAIYGIKPAETTVKKNEAGSEPDPSTKAKS